MSTRNIATSQRVLTGFDVKLWSMVNGRVTVMLDDRSCSGLRMGRRLKGRRHTSCTNMQVAFNPLFSYTGRINEGYMPV